MESDERREVHSFDLVKGGLSEGNRHARRKAQAVARRKRRGMLRALRAAGCPLTYGQTAKGKAPAEKSSESGLNGKQIARKLASHWEVECSL